MVKAGASRHVVASSASALFHCLVAQRSPVATDTEVEVKLRMQQIRTVLSEQVEAAATGGKPRVIGRARAARNIATHSGLGAGSEAFGRALMEPQQAQRGHRKEHEKKTAAKESKYDSHEMMKDGMNDKLVQLMDGSQDVIIAKLESPETKDLKCLGKLAAELTAAFPQDPKVQSDTDKEGGRTTADKDDPGNNVEAAFSKNLAPITIAADEEAKVVDYEKVSKECQIEKMLMKLSKQLDTLVDQWRITHKRLRNTTDMDDQIIGLKADEMLAKEVELWLETSNTLYDQCQETQEEYKTSLANMKYQLKLIQESAAAKLDMLCLTEQLDTLADLCQKTQKSYEAARAEMDSQLESVRLDFLRLFRRAKAAELG